MAATHHQSLIDHVRSLANDETGALRRVAPLRVALCYPSPYHVGMSSLGFQTVYRQIHQHPGATAERFFLPDDVEAHQRSRAPPFSVETQSPLRGYPVIAVSVAYELEIAGLLTLLELAGIRALREERSSRDPLIVAGGPLTFSNPTPLEPFVDVIIQGEAENLVPQLLEVAGLSKDEALAALVGRPGFFLPGHGGERFHVARADDTLLPARSQILTPNTELRSMFLIEPERGCSRGCHYCVMRRSTNGGMRTVSPERVLELVPEHARRVGLVGAAVTDHPRITELLRAIVDSGREVGVSSLRADRLTPELVRALRDGGARVLTVAADGASQRLRDAVDRKHSEEQILRAAHLAREAKMDRLKVYNMVGLPTETDEDVDELVRFTRELSELIPVVLGVAPFVAKRNTPMDGAPFAGIRTVDHRLERLRAGLCGRAEVRPTSARWAWVEYMLAQSSSDAGLAVMDAVRAGGSFAAYRKAFSERGITPHVARRLPDDRRKKIEWPVVNDGPSA